MKTKITLLVLTALLGLTNVFANSMPGSENSVENEIMTTGDNSIIISAGKRIYTLDMNTYQATLLATSPYVTEINSIASDNQSGWIFYFSNHISTYNWTIYGYNVYTNTHKNFGSVRHFFTSTGHAYSSRGLGSGGATFYNGKLIIAMEYPAYCNTYGRSATGNQNPKDELPNNVRSTGTVSNTMFTNERTATNTATEDDTVDDSARGNGETPADFEIIDADAANALNDLVSDYIPEGDLPADETADGGLAQRGTSNAESYYTYSSYNNYIYLLEISFSGLSDASGSTAAVSDGTPVYDNWGYSSFLYRGELGDIVVDDNGQLYAATSYQVQAFNFGSKRYDWANNEDVYAQMAKDKHSELQLLKNKRQCSTTYYNGCPHTYCTTKSFVQGYTAPSHLRTYNNIQLGGLNEITGLQANDVGKITDASDYIRLTPPVSYKIKGFVFDDNNENGNYDSGQGETKLAGVQVKLYADNNEDGVLDAGDTVIESQNTNTSGDYTFNDVQVQKTVVEVTVPNDDNDFTYTLTTPATVSVTGATSDITGIKFGINKQPVVVNVAYDVFGTVYDDNNENATLETGEPGLNNVALTLYADTNADGILDAGDTVITTTTSGTDGSYSFLHVCIQNTIVAVTVPSDTGNFTYTLTTPGTQAIDSINTNVTGVDFGINEEPVIDYSISGTVYDDDNENAVFDTLEGTLEAVTVTLYSDNNSDGALDAGDTVITSVNTGITGAYNFANVAVANTVVSVTVPTNTANFTYTLTTAASLDSSSGTTDVTGLDFGINKVQVIDYSISGNVYDDNDESGAQDAGEDDLDAITVTLYADNNVNGTVDAGDTVITSAVTGVDGTYSFLNVTVENTLVTVTVPSNTGDFTYTLTTPGEQNTSSTTINVTNVNFGINEIEVIDYSISGNTFLDADDDGNYDTNTGSADGPFVNVVVRLYEDVNVDGNLDASDVLIGTNPSSASGTYQFDNVSVKNTLVKFTLPSNNPNFNYRATTADVVSLLNRTSNVTDVNFGIFAEQIIDYNISGTVFDDDNENAVIDAGEAGLNNITVTLYADNNADGNLDVADTTLTSTITGVDGTYSFANITSPDVLAVVTVPGNTATFTYVLTTSNTQAASSAITDVTGLDFGVNEIEVINYDISGTVFDDNNGNGVRDMGEGFIGATVVTLYADTNNDGILDAGDTVISTTTTNTMTGNYNFTGVTVRNTLVVVSVPGNTASFTYVPTTSTERAVSSTITNVPNVNFGIDRVQVINYDISGTVFDDDNANGTIDAAETGRLNNVILTLYADNDGNGRVGAGDTIITTATTATDGTFNFSNVTVQNTLVVVTVPTNTVDFTYTLTTSERRVTSSTVNDVLNVNFGINQQSTLYAISGNVFNDINGDGNRTGDGGLTGVTVRLFDDLNQNGVVDRSEPQIATTVTDRNGNYQFTGLSTVFVVVQVIVPANTAQFLYTSTTPVSVPLSSGITTSVDFGITRTLVILYNVRGTVWDDDNANGIIDGVEPRLEGIGITLYNDVNANGALDAADTVLNVISTLADGTYEFTGVNIRNVIVEAALPSNGTFTTPGNRAISSINTDANNIDFGIDIVPELFEITGVVFDDDNENGLFDAGEGSIDGLTVEIYADTDGDGLFDPNFDALIAFTQTNNGGFLVNDPNYIVVDINPGLVHVVVVIPAPTTFISYTPTYDPDSGTVNPDGVFTTLMTTSLSQINYGINFVDLNSTSRVANTDDVLFTNGSVTEDVSERLRLYPNPTVRQIAINAEEFTGDVTVEVYNDRGYKVMTTTTSSFGNEYRVDVQRLAPGMYYAKFSSNNKVASKKFIKR
ncbi:T9SS type A sorting domain-containing protein [Kordia sp. YSTF-M3]|uniref:T9SS type A sorting domain-containing protein n=1 Tax=Kordia aestuariivivens TaxID=2759037 RepID=A0ABR7Q9X1_9FLAO|nr:SdrD B-like domain-containing protein [Kordia aestuariivivens]MBC8755317.1 T9SS type A sorting domain-containing protein [Kordia aestuariivivens]